MILIYRGCCHCLADDMTHALRQGWPLFNMLFWDPPQRLHGAPRWQQPRTLEGPRPGVCQRQQACMCGSTPEKQPIAN
jgi:hypothetical protein